MQVRNRIIDLSVARFWWLLGQVLLLLLLLLLLWMPCKVPRLGVLARLRK